MRVLFVESNDSFSWNVLDALPCDRSAVSVVPGRQVAANLDIVSDADVVVVGPGPTDPVRAGIAEVVRRAATLKRPLLGICLGHQALGLAFGARLVRTAPTHGKVSTVTFRPSRLFPSFVGSQRVMRYHSLALAEVESPLRVFADTADGVIMAIEHERLPMAGLQFHPDSYATPRGREMLTDFFEHVR